MATMTEDLIRNVVEQILSQMGGQVGSNGSALPPRARTASTRRPTPPCRPPAKAFQAFKTQPLADRCPRPSPHDQDDLRRPGPRSWDGWELDETGIGRLDHKVAKLRDDAIPARPGRRVPPGPKTYSGDDGLTLGDYAPFGVIGAITPVTHSLPTLAGNAISMLASGNTVVFNAHPSGAKVAAEGVRRFNRAIRQAIGIDDLLTIIDPPTLESAAALFDNTGVKVLVVTGGPAVARAALESKRRAIVAGPGNPPVVVDATACLVNAAKSIIEGAAFDNNLLCIGEKQVFAVAEIFDKLMEQMARHGGFRLNPQQIDALTKAAFTTGQDGKLHVNKDLVGKDPAVLGKHAGVNVPDGTQVLFGETGAEHPFVDHEQMMPFLPFVRVPDVNRGIELARLTEHGYGHTAVLHSRDTSVMTKMGKAMDCTIFVVNGPERRGASGLGGEGYSVVLDRWADRRGRLTTTSRSPPDSDADGESRGGMRFV